ncbi:MAG TPA: SdrD B-like domain-containing protein [Humisphaera sp.]
MASVEPLEVRSHFSTTDITGVEAAAFDQPQVHALFRNSPTGNPLGGTGPDDGYAIKAFLDTGASSVLLSQETAQALGLDPIVYNGQQVTFHDIGVAGGEAFDVSPAVYGGLAPVRSISDGDLPVSDFDSTFGPVRTQINQNPADSMLGGFDVIGMPAMQGKVVVMDPTPLNASDPTQFDGMRTFLYAPGTPYNAAARATDPGIPAVNRHVKVSYGNFGPFTSVSPAGAPKPTISSNPFVGPNPVRAAGTVDNTPGVALADNGKTTTGSFLLDTGAASSFISTAVAGQLGVRYRAGTYATDNPILEYTNGTLVPNQFVVPIGGIGGSVNAAGYKIDSLTLPTTEGEGIRFLDAPVLVLDVTVQNPSTGQTLTLDGDLGMNYFVASTSLDGGGLGGGAAAGAFDWVTFDQPNGLLGLQLDGAGPVSPPPPPVTTATIGGQVFHDLNANGAADGADAGLAGRTVYLDLDGSGTLNAGDRTTTTDADGGYSFAGLATGRSYKVRQVVPSGWTGSAPSGSVYTVTPTAGQVVGGKDFGAYTTGSVKGTLFNDANANGVRDSGEGILAGWTLWLDLNNNGTRDTTDRATTTNASGAYSFTGLKPGTYKVNLVKQSGWRQSTGGGGTQSVAVTSAAATTKDFGATKRALVSGFVFNDADRDGIRDSGEAGLSGWRVYLDANKNGVWDSTERSVLTSSTGSWSFGDLLAGTNYAIRVVQQAGWTRTAPSTGSYSITPTSGQTIGGKNFGERK